MLIALASLYVALLLVKAALAMRSAGKSPKAETADVSRVAVVQPILSGDPRLSETLEANLVSLPAAMFVWLVDEDDPVAQTTCATLKARHPQIRIELVVVPPVPEGENPKLFKLERARSIVGDRVWLVLDDDTRMPGATLAGLLRGLESAEIATALPAYVDDGRWPSRLLAQFVNNNAAMTYLPLLNVADPVTINGMAYAMRASTVDRLEGFGRVMRTITDDLAVAQRVLGAGGRICQTASPVWVQTTVSSGDHYWRQMHRWYVFALLLFGRQSMAFQAAIGVLGAAPPLCLWAIAVAAVWQSSTVAWALVAGVLAVRAATLAMLQQKIYGRAMHRLALSVVSELLQPLHLLHACVDRRIVWRTRTYRVRRDLTFETYR